MKSSSPIETEYDIIKSIFILSYGQLYRGGRFSVLKKKLQAAFMPLWKSDRVSPARVIIVGFLLLILLGTALLMLPFSTRQWGGASFFDALFTATSATCVTGLVVRDTASCWSGFGQLVILLLIQVGGMGVVTMAVAIFIFSGSGSG